MGKPNSNDIEMVRGNGMIDTCTEMVYSSKMTHGNELVVSAEMAPITTSSCQRKKSAIWEHFTPVDVSEGGKRASCNHCKRTFAHSSGSRNVGTSHLTRHIKESCTVLRNQQEGKLLLPLVVGTDIGGEGTVERPSKRYRYSSFANASFHQDRSCAYLAKMIILNDYPLHIVEQPAFLSFIESMQPRFKVIDINTMEEQVYDVYRKERDNLKQELGTLPGRISLTVGSWTTSQTLGYISLAGQFIDSEWNLHRRMLNFVMVPRPHSENALCEAINTSLSKWNMKDKIFAITLDNDCSSHDIYSANLRDHIFNKNILMLKGHLFVLRCYAHNLNAAARDVIASVKSVVYNIRESIKFIKSSPSCEEKFAEIALQLEIPNTQTLCLDVTTEWNTTYLMLLAALDYKQAFTLLDTCDENYSEAPSTEDWKKVEAACSYLRLLYDSAHGIMAAANPTANIFFHEAWVLQLELSNAAAYQDAIFSSIAKKIHDRFDKYWKDCNVVMAIAVVMDPRFKMKLVEFAYSKIYGVKAAKYVKVVHDAVRKLYSEYVAQPLPLVRTYADQGATNDEPANENNNTSAPPPSAGDGLLDFDIYLSEIVMNQPVNSELDQYLAEALNPRIPEFDILNWWKLNTIKYPTLSRMAQDVLAIPMSTVCSSSSIFSAGTGTEARMLDDYRSSLRPEIVEALFCAKDWLQYSPIVAKSPSTVSVKMEQTWF